MKYIVIAEMYPVLFTSNFGHYEVCPDLNVTSAGFVDITDGKAHCYGESTMLKIKSNPELDEMLIDILLRLED